MGDISRHRDIFLNLREAIPATLLEKCNLVKADLTYLEMGNYLTDVSQFRDPVMYIFSKQRIWREFIIPEVAKKAEVYRGLAVLAGAASLAAAQVIKELTSGTTSQIAKYAGPALAGLGGALAALPTDTYAGIGGADDWIDKMFGTPIERTTGDLKKRDEKHYGYVGQFFRYFIEGITHLLFADDITNKVKGEWGKLDRIPQKSVTEVFEEFFTQYYPHEHTDQPPYVWDASERPRHQGWYGPSKRQRTLADKEDIGIMNAVDHHYVQYLSEGFSDLEQEWRTIKVEDIQARRKWLIRMGKLLHGVEDWYFHSNVVELIRVRGLRPIQGIGENTEDFLKRFVQETSEKDHEFMDVDKTEQVRLKRRLYRRLRFPQYDRGDRTNSGGKISKKTSTLSLNHAYPAFPSQQDTAHTLLHALENLERKVRRPSSPSGPSALPPWTPCVVGKLIAARGGDGQRLLEEKAKARGVTKDQAIAALLLGGTERDKATAVIIDVLREWLPLVVTLLDESERQRLIAGIDPLEWPVEDSASAPPRNEMRGKVETDKQLERHRLALKPKLNEGFNENNYERAARYLVECGFLNISGQRALVTAFGIDQKSQQLLEGAPGSGGFLIKFAVDLQKVLDEGDAATEKLNGDKNVDSSIFNQASDNGAFNEIIGSHSLMSKATLTSPPFFDDAKILASLASSSVFHIMLEQISAPISDRRLPWKTVLHHLIRFPVVEGGWERRAIAFFRDPKNNGKISRYTDLPELARLVESALRSPAALNPWRKGTKDDELKEEYIKLESKLSQYRYP